MSTLAKIALALVVTVSSLSAQNPTGSQSRAAAPASSPTIVMPPPVVYVVPGGYYGGYYTGYYGYGAGAYLAPAATLPAQSTGISLSDRAGISLSGPYQTGVSTAVPATSVGTYGSPGYGVSGYGVPGYSGAFEGTGGGETLVSEGERPIQDLGPSYYAGAEPAGSAAAPSLGEIAAKNKAAHPQHVRMYTNADAERIVRTVKIGSSTTKETPQQNAPK